MIDGEYFGCFLCILNVIIKKGKMSAYKKDFTNKFNINKVNNEISKKNLIYAKSKDCLPVR